MVLIGWVVRFYLLVRSCRSDSFVNYVSICLVDSLSDDGPTSMRWLVMGSWCASAE